MSMVENLKELEEKGMNQFLRSQEDKYECPKCGDVISVHDSKCYTCMLDQLCLSHLSRKFSAAFLKVFLGLLR